MKKILFLLFLLPLMVKGQKLRIKQDTCKQDKYLFYYKLIVDTVLFEFVDYKYEYRSTHKRRKSINNIYNCGNTKLWVKCDCKDINIVCVDDGGIPTFKFILWLKDKVYVIHVDNYIVTRIIST